MSTCTSTTIILSGSPEMVSEATSIVRKICHDHPYISISDLDPNSLTDIKRIIRINDDGSRNRNNMIHDLIPTKAMIEVACTYEYAHYGPIIAMAAHGDYLGEADFEFHPFIAFTRQQGDDLYSDTAYLWTADDPRARTWLRIVKSDVLDVLKPFRTHLELRRKITIGDTVGRGRRKTILKLLRDGNICINSCYGDVMLATPDGERLQFLKKRS